MREKLSIMVPLETLPYWEPAEDPSLLVWLGFVIGLPLLIVVLIILLVRAGDLARAFRTRDRGTAGAFWVNPGSAEPLSLDASEDETPFTVGERESLARGVVRAQQDSGLAFSLFVGPAPVGVEPADFAEELFDSLADGDRTVLIMCDPDSEALEWVIGEAADRLIDDSAIEQASAVIDTKRQAQQTTLGLAHAVDQVAAHARQPGVLS